MSSIKFFFTPIVYPKSYQKSFSETLLEKVDSYFYLGGKQAKVLSAPSKTVKKVVLIDSQSSYIETALKIASYLLIVPFIVMFTAKIALRTLHTFHLIKTKNKTAEKTNNQATHSINIQKNSSLEPLPHPKCAAYICPPSTKHFNAPLPKITDASQIVGVYGNILYPEDKELKHQNTLYSWIKQSLNNQKLDPFPLTLEELKEVSLYTIQHFPRKAVRVYLASCLKEDPNNPSLAKEKAMGLFNIFKAITSAISKSSSSHQLLSSEFEKCANNLEKQIDGYIYFFLNKLKTPEERQAHLLKEQFESIKAPFHWELRQKVFKQMVEKIQAVAPNSPYFLALQEVTPEALSGLKKTLADKNLQWISFNNLSGKKTLEPGQESVAGEATSFTTTLALSPDLEVLKTELGDLPTESGSIRKILGVKVRNKHSHQVYHLFTTHTDHVVQKDLYTRTAKKIHEFASHFFKGDPHKDNVVLGGDLNAFEDKGGASYLQNLINLFKGYKDFRETDYYAPPQIACSSSIGRSGRSGNPKINKQGFIERNALDHILIGKGIKLTSATREALVYDDTGALLDYYQNKDAYIKKLQERQTFSDHLFNVVVFA